MSSFSDEELAEFKEVFSYFAEKENPDKMPADDLATLLRGLGRNPLEAEISEMLEANGNKDTVDFAYFLVCMEKPLKQPKQFKEKEIFEAFEVFDPEGSGFIDKNELRNILVDLAEGFNKTEWEIFMGEADPEGTGKVDYKQFLQNMHAKKKEKSED